MKKSVLFRIALVMLVLTMVTSCFVGGTFAKYVTSGEGMDSARVAKFGVTVTGNGTMFATEYETDNAVFTETNSVVSSGQVFGYSNLVAPGTEGDMASVVITGTPEVAVRVSYEVTELKLEGWNVNGDYYCPLKVTVAGTPLCGLDYENADAFAKAITDNVAAYSKDYPALTNLADADNGNEPLAVSWAWAFEDATAYIHGTQTDENDTALGDQAAANQAATIDLTIKTTVTQID